MTSNTPLPAANLFARKSEIIRRFIRKHMGMKYEHERHARRLDGEGGVA